jgi:hypothetical protein
MVANLSAGLPALSKDVVRHTEVFRIESLGIWRPSAIAAAMMVTSRTRLYRH